MLILISGLPGSGKSTVARNYVARYGGVHISSDLLRNSLGLLGHYEAADKEKVYAAMLEQTRDALAKGQHVVVDSTFFRQTIRAPFEQIAEMLKIPVFRIEICAAEETIRRRLQSQRPDSEADFVVYDQIRRAFEAWTAPHLTLFSDTRSPDELAKAIYDYCHEPT